MEFNYFDISVSVIILLLGLKGIFNGFFKEVFGLIGIIGGIFVASRVGTTVGEYLNNTIFHFESLTAANFSGFLATLAIFWIVMIFVGIIFKKLTAISGLGIMDRIFGFIFGASKFFLITTVIIYSIHNVKAMKPMVDKYMSNSFLFPVMLETGAYIMKLDTTEIQNNLKDTISINQEQIKETIDGAKNDMVENAKKEFSKNIQKALKGNE